MSVLIAARHLVNRYRHGERRAEDLRELANRYEREPAADRADPQDVKHALELRRLRQELSAAFGPVSSCQGCAKGHPLPFGRWPGGHCCGSSTDALFTSDELAALKLAGTKLGEMTPPRSDFAGCAFRGPEGCSLAAEHRPNLCVAYTCRDLERELKGREDRAELLRLQAELRSAFESFVARRRARAEAALFED